MEAKCLKIDSFVIPFKEKMEQEAQIWNYEVPLTEQKLKNQNEQFL